MFTSDGGRRLSALLVAALLSTALHTASALADAPRLGVPVPQAEIDSIDLTVMPDGSGLPAGSGSVADGAAVYRSQCLACHGPEGRDGINDALAGGYGTLATSRPVKTIGSFWPYATTLFDYVRRAMPYNAPGSLGNDEVYAVTAYLLNLNGIVSDDAVLDAETLPRVRMPNRDGFTSAFD
jgi:cytochrome c